MRFTIHSDITHCKLKKRLLHVAFMSAMSTLSMAVVLPVAQAQTAQQINFQIQPAPLLDAIVVFGQQSGLQVTYEHALIAGKQSRGVAGTMTAAAALQQLLADAGVAFRFVNDSTISLVRIPAGNALSAGSGALVLNTIEVTGVKETNPADVPYSSAGSSAYISGEQIERFRGTSPGDFLAGVPGVLNGDGRNSGAVDVNIRGMQGQGRVPVTIDGASNEVTVYRGYNGSTARNYIDPDFIGKVEIEKGATGSGDATGATGGMVRMTTIVADDILLPGRSYGVRIKGGLNTNSSAPPAASTVAGIVGGTNATMNRSSLLAPTGGSGSIAVAGKTEYVDLVAAYSRRYNGNYYAGERGDDAAKIAAVNAWTSKNVGLSAYRAGEQVLNTSANNSSWLFKTIIKFSDEQKLELAHNRYMSEYGEVMPTQIWGDMPYQAWLHTVDLMSTTARYRLNPSHNDLIDLRVDAFFSNLDQRLNSAFRSASTGALSPALFYAGQRKSGINISNTSKFDTGIGALSLNYGAGFVREFVGNPDGYTYKPEDNQATGTPREGSRKEQNGFVTIELKPLPWLTLSQNARYSHSSTYDDVPIIDYGIGGYFVRKMGPVEHSHQGWSGITSLTVEPVKGFQVYAKYGSVLRSPSIFESLGTLSFVLGPDVNNVDPERNRSKEIGANLIKSGVFTATDKLKFHAGYFDNNVDGYITRTNIGTQMGTFTYYALGRVNLDYARMKGLEMSLAYDMGNVFGDISWNHYFSTMFCVRDSEKTQSTRSKCTPGGIYNSFSLQQVPPKDTVALNLGTRLLDRKLTLGGRLNYIGPRMVRGMGDGRDDAYMQGQINPSNWNAYTLLDVYASYKYSDALQFDMTIDNLTDRYYMDALNTGALMPAPGRTLRASMTYKF